MITEVAQRWANGTARWVPHREVFRPQDFEVMSNAPYPDIRSFVEKHHYSKCWPAQRRRFGLYRKGGALVGAVVFSAPMHPAVLRPFTMQTGLELGRLVLLDDVPFNAESWLIAECFHRLRQEGFEGVVSYSDPEPRTTLDGHVVFTGHIGGIYCATNGVYTGRIGKSTLRLLPDGSVYSARTIAKVQTRDSGWNYGVDILCTHGASRPPPNADLRVWLAEWLPRLTRRLQHGGNHRYSWAIDRRARKLLPKSLPYPKFSHPHT